MSLRTFDFCRAMTRLCRDITDRHPGFGHIRMDDVLVTFAQTRAPVEWGMQAKLTPLRFQNGALTETRNGTRWTVQRIYHQEREMLYLLTFYLPRFLNMTFEEKLVTVFHELYHISPQFNGDIRRFAGPYYMHSSSQAGYDRQMAVFSREYLKMQPPPELFRFLHMNFRQLKVCCGDVVGLRLAIPRLIPVPGDAA